MMINPLWTSRCSSEIRFACLVTGFLTPLIPVDIVPCTKTRWTLLQVARGTLLKPMPISNTSGSRYLSSKQSEVQSATLECRPLSEYEIKLSIQQMAAPPIPGFHPVYEPNPRPNPNAGSQLEAKWDWAGRNTYSCGQSSNLPHSKDSGVPLRDCQKTESGVHGSSNPRNTDRPIKPDAEPEHSSMLMPES